MKETIKAIQRKVGVTADGIIGKNTLAALCKALGIEEAQQTLVIPTQAEVRSGRSIFGHVGCEENLVNIEPPYPLYYEGTKVKTIRVHKLIAEPVRNALKEVLDRYGVDAIHRLGLDQYSGSYNYRRTTSGASYSMHAWGIALDFAAEDNAYHMHRPHASLSSPECSAWWEIWEKHGAVSLGRERDVDWMHLQFAKL